MYVVEAHIKFALSEHVQNIVLMTAAFWFYIRSKLSLVTNT